MEELYVKLSEKGQLDQTHTTFQTPQKGEDCCPEALFAFCRTLLEVQANTVNMGTKAYKSLKAFVLKEALSLSRSIQTASFRSEQASKQPTSLTYLEQRSLTEIEERLAERAQSASK